MGRVAQNIQDPDFGTPPAQFTPLCPVKFMHMRSVAYFTGVAPEDGTGISKKTSTANLFRGKILTDFLRYEE